MYHIKDREKKGHFTIYTRKSSISSASIAGAEDERINFPNADAHSAGEYFVQIHVCSNESSRRSNHQMNVRRPCAGQDSR